MQIATLALLWVQLEDYSQSYSNFLNSVVNDDFDEKLECDVIFYKCEQANK